MNIFKKFLASSNLAFIFTLNSRRSSIQHWSPYKRNWNTKKTLKQSLRKPFNTSRWGLILLPFTNLMWIAELVCLTYSICIKCIKCNCLRKTKPSISGYFCSGLD